MLTFNQRLEYDLSTNKSTAEKTDILQGSPPQCIESDGKKKTL